MRVRLAFSSPPQLRSEHPQKTGAEEAGRGIWERRGSVKVCARAANSCREGVAASEREVGEATAAAVLARMRPRGGVASGVSFCLPSRPPRPPSFPPDGFPLPPFPSRALRATRLARLEGKGRQRRRVKAERREDAGEAEGQDSGRAEPACHGPSQRPDGRLRGGLAGRKGSLRHGLVPPEDLWGGPFPSMSYPPPTRSG